MRKEKLSAHHEKLSTKRIRSRRQSCHEFQAAIQVAIISLRLNYRTHFWTPMLSDHCLSSLSVTLVVNWLEFNVPFQHKHDYVRDKWHWCIVAKRLDGLGCHLNPVYTIQPVVKLVWQSAVPCKQTSNRLSNRFDNQLDVCLHYTAGCQTGLITVLNEQLFVQTVRSTGCETGLYNRFENRLYTR